MVSVIIPSYNRAHCIRKSIESVLAQTYDDIELIIVDDGSTDGTRELVESINDSRIRYIYQKNAGACAARNHGIDMANGEFIAFQDSDDIWLPRKLERQMSILQEYPDVDIVVCQTECVKLDNSVFVSMQDCKEGIIPMSQGPFGISTQVILMRKCVSNKVRFDIKVTRYQDLDYMLMAMRDYKVYFLHEPLVKRFIGKDSISNNANRIYDMSVYFSEKHGEYMNRGSRLSRFFSNNLYDACACGEISKEQRTRYARRAVDLDRSFRSVLKFLLIKINAYSLIRKVIRKGR